MRLRTGIILALATVLALAATGCSKDQDKQKLQGQVAQLEAELKALEEENAALRTQADKAALQATNEKRLLQEELTASEIRLLFDPIDQFQIEPYAATENGFLLISGERTYTLIGYPKATKVQFYWKDVDADGEPQLLGEDTDGRDGWSWTGSLPYAHTKAFWAEIHYPGGIKTTSAVLPIRNPGK